MYSLPRLTSKSVKTQINTSIETENKKKFHFSDNIMYKMSKQALQDYLKSGVIDQRIVQMNLVKMSKLKNSDLSILNDFYSQPSTSRIEQEQAQQILSKIKTHQIPKNSYFNEKSENKSYQNDVNFYQIEEQLKQCLRTKMNVSKLFNGTYLVDPSINDLTKKSQTSKPYLQMLHKMEPQKRITKKTKSFKRQSSILNPQYCKQNSIQNMEIEDVTDYMSSRLIESKANIEQLVEKYKIIDLTPEQKSFFNLVQNCDIKGLLLLFQDKSFDVSLINSADEKGFYPIHIAIKKQNVSLFKLLLKFGAKLNVTTRNGKSIQDLSQLYENQEIIDLIKRNHYYK
ncbi:unnamed protein product [Paramecium octaurelia]|uniref:Uncharacterized protein n=1 Tax=Paramecium octaurelia TaxID=43137 RepID=A0A8S1XS80_PAROT|nr:unnamed protein product [Paramecium octaurelia]